VRRKKIKVDRNNTDLPISTGKYVRIWLNTSPAGKMWVLDSFITPVTGGGSCFLGVEGGGRNNHVSRSSEAWRVYQTQSIQSASFFSSRQNWVPHPPHPQRNIAPPPFGSIGGDTLLAGGTQFRRRDSLNMWAFSNMIQRFAFSFL
jgi:hypothetical protein